MAKVWVTYAWVNNTSGDVDFVAQELQECGLDVSLDRWNLGAGKRLWEQIEEYITDPTRCDGWVLFATQESLGSEACKEEYAYALDRALHTRGADFPLVGLFPSTVECELIPAGIRTRLYVSLTDAGWKERIKAAAERRSPDVTRPKVDPYLLRVHELTGFGDFHFAIEIRPRAGSWSPFMVAIPAAERGRVTPSVYHGPKDRVPTAGTVLYSAGSVLSDDGTWWISFAQNEATPTQSYYTLCKELPTEVLFGVCNGSPQYRIKL